MLTDIFKKDNDDPMLWKKVSFEVNENGKSERIEGDVCKVTNTDYWVCNRDKWYSVPKESVITI